MYSQSPNLNRAAVMVCVFDPLHRFLLCNQATLSPAPRVPYRQLSSQQSVDTTGGRREEGTGEGGEPMVAEATGERLKKAMSSEDEVARLTIEVCVHVCLLWMMGSSESESVCNEDS